MILFQCPNCGERDATPIAEIDIKLSSIIRGVEDKEQIKLAIAQPSMRRPPAWDNLQIEEIHCSHCGTNASRDAWGILLVCDYCGKIIPDGLKNLELYRCSVERVTRCTPCWKEIGSRYCANCTQTCKVRR